MRSRLLLALAALPALAVPLAPVALTRAPTPAEPSSDRVQVLADPIPSPSVTPRRPTARKAATRARRSAVARPHRTAGSPAGSTPRTPPATHRPSPRNGYPWASDTSGGSDPWGFTKRQCVSYVAWRLDRVSRTVSTRQGWGDAHNWDDTARRRGQTVSTRPAVGSVAQWDAGERSDLYSAGSVVPNGSFAAGALGHVAWVTQVYADGSVQVAQYNGYGDRRYSSMHVRAPRYLRL